MNRKILWSWNFLDNNSKYNDKMPAAFKTTTKTKHTFCTWNGGFFSEKKKKIVKLSSRVDIHIFLSTANHLTGSSLDWLFVWIDFLLLSMQLFYFRAGNWLISFEEAFWNDFLWIILFFVSRFDFFLSTLNRRQLRLAWWLQ